MSTIVKWTLCLLIAGCETLRASVDAGVPTVSGAKGKRSRRSWSAEEKRQIVDEAMAPGASVAEIARRHGVNANLVFTWCKAVRSAPSVTTAELTASATRLVGDASPVATEVCAFVPVGVIGRAEDGEPALAVGTSPAVVSGASSPRTALPRPGMDERPGVIEIDLTDGVRLRVDAFVNERALRRVLAVLKVTS
jgi:transposase